MRSFGTQGTAAVRSAGMIAVIFFSLAQTQIARYRVLPTTIQPSF
jgi:hypothetical protein